MEPKSSLSKLDDFDLDDTTYYPSDREKELCPQCGERLKQRRSLTCRQCFLDNRNADPRWKGSGAWREAKDD